MMESQLVKRPAAERVSKWEELAYTRQFSYEWQGKDLRDTENKRVRKRDKQKKLQTYALWRKAQILYEWQIKELGAQSLGGESWEWAD
jgi:hypothetical protein